VRAVVLVVAACGRLHFDPLGDDDVATCVTSPEVCNGIDDNCDGRIDEGCACNAFSTMVQVDSLLPANHPVWTGEGYYFVHPTGGNVQIAHCDQTGAVTSPAFAFLPGFPVRLAWTGQHLLATGANLAADLVVVKLATDGTIVNQVTVGKGQTSFISRTGRDFDIAWSDLNGTVMHFNVQRVDENLEPLGPVRTLIVPDVSTLTAVATSRNVVLADELSNGVGAAFAFDVSMHIVDVANLVSVTVSGDETGFVATTLDNVNVVATYHADPDGNKDRDRTVLPIGTVTPTVVTGATRGRGDHVVVMLGSQNAMPVGWRYDVGGSSTEMVRLPITGGITTTRIGGYADSERTAIVFSYQDTPSSQQVIAQTCP